MRSDERVSGRGDGVGSAMRAGWMSGGHGDSGRGRAREGAGVIWAGRQPMLIPVTFLTYESVNATMLAVKQERAES
jgi:hypothetical protein